MTDIVANPNINPRRYSPTAFRLLEILPGATAWSGLLLPFILARPFPHVVTISIILFDVYWLIKSLEFAVNLVRGYYHMQSNIRREWQPQLDGSLALRESGNSEILDWREVYQAVIFTTYKEDFSILDASIRSVAEATYPSDRKILVLATEQRDSENARTISSKLKEKYKDSFAHFIVTEHPDGIVGEVRGKGANATWAAKELVAQIEKLNIPLDHVVVSTADADCRFPSMYFQCLSYVYSTMPDRIHHFYQPIATYLNNLWEAPAISRIVAVQTTAFLLATSMREHKLVTYSTHAMSLQTLRDMDYWCTSVVNEDSRQFYRAYFHYKGNFKPTPLFMPVYMDAVYVGSTRETLKNLYLQQQRWAYGVEHFPYIVLESFKQKKIRLLDRAVLVWRSWNSSFSWATQSFFIAVVGWLPIILNSSFRNQIIATNFPLVTKDLLTLTWGGIIACGAIAIHHMLPARKLPKGPMRFFYLLPLVGMWILMPITSIFFGAFAGIDSQTRLMFGRYIGFRVTEKKTV